MLIMTVLVMVVILLIIVAITNIILNVRNIINYIVLPNFIWHCYCLSRAKSQRLIKKHRTDILSIVYHCFMVTKVPSRSVQTITVKHWQKFLRQFSQGLLSQIDLYRLPIVFVAVYYRKKKSSSSEKKYILGLLCLKFLSVLIVFFFFHFARVTNAK